ncbi:MAG TPA: hypothetical protein VNX21_05935 [Candidatus Thermoplasmatota archaeon]|nr:hypothetical protein [Candidatus Thermoplasmatota archaeon]
MYGADNAGYIRYQIGNILLAQTEAIKLGDVKRYVDLCYQAITLCFPKLAKTLDEKQRVADELEAMLAPAVAEYESATRQKDAERVWPKLFRACQRMMRILLNLMSEESLYAYVDKGVRSGRDLALRDEDDDVPELRA